MGQRLVMTIYESVEKQEKPLMNIYYHWSAYSTYAYIEALKFINVYKDMEDFMKLFVDIKDRKKLVMFLVKILEKKGARINIGDYEYVEKEYPELEFLKTDVDRNEGLISLSEKEMADSEKWGEGFLNIFLKEREVVNNCYWGGYDSIEEYIKDNGLELTEEEVKATEEEVKAIGELDYDIMEATFDNITDRINAMNEMGFFFRYNGKIWCFIE